jgi:hypothetical protein
VDVILTYPMWVLGWKRHGFLNIMYGYINCIEKPAETQTTIRLASHLLTVERLTPNLEDMSLNPCMTWIQCTDWRWKDPLGQVFLQNKVFWLCIWYLYTCFRPKKHHSEHCRKHGRTSSSPTTPASKVGHVLYYFLLVLVFTLDPWKPTKCDDHRCVYMKQFTTITLL